MSGTQGKLWSRLRDLGVSFILSLFLLSTFAGLSALMSFPLGIFYKAIGLVLSFALGFWVLPRIWSFFSGNWQFFFLLKFIIVSCLVFFSLIFEQRLVDPFGPTLVWLQLLTLGAVVRMRQILFGDHQGQNFGLVQPMGVVIALVVFYWAGRVGGTLSGASRDFAATFWHLFQETAPALLLAYGISGALDLVPIDRFTKWMSGGSSLTRSLKGMAVGLPISVCSCGVVPLYKTLIDKKVPVSGSMAFLIATPELGIDALIISLPLLGTEMTLWRLVAAAVLAVTVGVVLGHSLDRKGQSSHHPEPETTHPNHALGCSHHSKDPKWMVALKKGYGNMVDSTGSWILLGLAIAALLQPLLAHYQSLEVAVWVEVILLTLTGIPVYVCAAGATPMVAMMVAQGISPGAGIAFLLAGPAANMTTFGMLRRLHGRWVAVAFGAVVIFVAIVLGIGINELGSDFGSQIPMGLVGDRHDHGWQLVFGLIMVIIFLVSVARIGLSGILDELVGSDRHSHQDHASTSHHHH